MGRTETTDQAIQKAFETLESNMYQMYLMGIGYVRGLNVEKNIELGLNNIELAANFGCLEAVEELINMYTYGIGVNIDKNMSKYWQSKVGECKSFAPKENGNSKIKK